MCQTEVLYENVTNLSVRRPGGIEVRACTSCPADVTSVIPNTLNGEGFIPWVLMPLYTYKYAYACKHLQHALCAAGVCVSMRHMEVEKVCQTKCGLVLAEKFSVPWQTSIWLPVLLVCWFGVFFRSLCGVWGKKRRKAVKARCLCPPFLLMINVWLSSEEKCFVIRVLKENYLEALSIFESCRLDNSMWWQSHNICPTRTCVYLRQPSPPTGWTKAALKGRFLTWKRSLVKSKGREMKLWWCCRSAACWAALGVRGTLLIEAWRDREDR